tara:strand:- start:1254 stop:1583 length:330 start_codon:yes stop_codon:yes gene_type:complete
MALTWNITETVRETTNDGIYIVYWTASDSETVGSGDDAVVHTGSISLSTGFTPNPTASGFTAYADLTEADIVTWIKDEMDTEALTEVETSIAAQITESKTPTIATGLPW